MKPLFLSIAADQISYDNNENFTDRKSYTFNSELELKENLELFKKQIHNSIDAIVITSQGESQLKENIFNYQNKKVDFANALENVFHVPVINNIEETENEDLTELVEKETKYSAWHLDYYGLDHGKRQYGQESMQTIGNGYFGLRGTYLEAKADDDNYPGTYVAGVFNQLGTPINGRNIINEDLVNLPNAQYVTFKIDDGEYFKIDENLIKESLRSLDMKTGVLTITQLIELADGKKLKVIEKKVADLNNFHDYYLQYSIQPLNFSGKIKILTEIDATVTNTNVERYRNLANKHLATDEIKNDNKTQLLFAHTNQSNIKIGIKAAIDYQNINNPSYAVDNGPEVASQTIEFDGKEGQIYTFEKAVAIFTSLETQKNLPEIIQKHQFQPDFETAENSAQLAWKDIWKKENIVVAGDITAQKLLHLNSYSMTCAAQTKANENLDVSIGSRGLTGEGYRGHIFWDELFDMNFYVLHSPKLVKALLMYRYNRLGAAMDYASDDDFQGAMYPWQSGMYGDEQSQEVHLNPITNKWDPDNSRKQRHVSLAVAYNVLTYYNISQDEEFMQEFGLEILLNIAKLWISMAQLDENTGRYSIKNVMGPDEFHEGYPGKDNEGLKNNAYTNIMVSWLFKKLAQLLKDQPSDVASENLQRSRFTSQDVEKLDDIRQNLKLDFKDDILGQFEGYFDLKRLDFEKYRQQYGNISRMDRILKAHNDSPDNYQVAKQADTLMALFNLREEDFFQIMDDLGYPVKNTDKFMNDNIKYYIERTTHGSTLSRIVYSMLLSRIDDDKTAWKLFYEALTSDYYDIQGGTTAEGIHLGVMGATLSVVTSVFAGVDTRGDTLEINPNVPEQWEEIDFNINFKGANIAFQITQDTATIRSDKDLDVKYTDKNLPLTANQEIELTY
ncbi:glycoside hydrolase family 65 protein [Companilactobacillus halodurans]|uniref:Glycoside hydrolase family 65 protein n=1 Tax=Companilactobacillus halodurans TaxID=2584183 RepID=A0A5P0ZZX8_9LACO|nr:glycosyl hydrolase family 65 protein [Companilactobacillus halodurans]MQS98580.1 glycoside hydrolase family 65 protein [Companilactobacillus halodurans]